MQNVVQVGGAKHKNGYQFEILIGVPLGTNYTGMTNEIAAACGLAMMVIIPAG